MTRPACKIGIFSQRVVVESSPICCCCRNKPGLVLHFRRYGSIGRGIIGIISRGVTAIVMAVGAPETCICNALVQGVSRSDIRDISRRISIMKCFPMAIIAGVNLAVPVSGLCAVPQSSGSRIRTVHQWRGKARRACKFYQAVPQVAGSAVRCLELEPEVRRWKSEIMTIPAAGSVHAAVCSIRKQIFYIMDIRIRICMTQYAFHTSCMPVLLQPVALMTVIAES